MVQPILYLVLFSAGFGLLTAAAATAFKGWVGWNRVFKYFVLFTGGAFLIIALLFLGFAAMYFAGGGH